MGVGRYLLEEVGLAGPGVADAANCTGKHLISDERWLSELGGAAFDPINQVLYADTLRVAYNVRLIPEQVDRAKRDFNR